MKNIVLLVLLTFGIKMAYAECTMSGMYFFPETTEISLNSMFIIEGYALSQKTIKSFKERSVYLESDSGALVELNLQDILTGQLELTQAIFCLSSELEPNTTYVLKYADQDKNEEVTMMRYNRDKRIRERVYWKTTDRKALETLNAHLNIEFEKTEVMHFGCGPSANAIFNVNNTSNTEIWYKTEVVDLTNNSENVYYIKGGNDTLYVGHGMCSGAFTYYNKGNYKIRFTPMNTDGESLKTTDWVTFQSPFINDKSPFGN